MTARRTVGSVIVITAVLGAAVACVLADPPPIDPLPPATRPTILTDIVAPLPGRLTSQPVIFTIPVAVDPNQTMQWRVFQDLDPTINAPWVGALNVTDDGGVTDFADAGNAVRVVSDPFNGLDFSTCHTFTFVVAFAFDTTTFSKPADEPGCISCGTRVDWTYEPVSDCTYDDAAPPTYIAEAGDGAAE